MLLIGACEPGGSLNAMGCSPLGNVPKPAAHRPRRGTARVPPFSAELRPSLRSSKAVGAAADLSPGALVLPSGIPTSSDRVVALKKDFPKVNLRFHSPCPAVCLEQQCRTWLWYREPESSSLGCFLFPNFYKSAAFSETRIPE